MYIHTLEDKWLESAKHVDKIQSDTYVTKDMPLVAFKQVV